MNNLFQVKQKMSFFHFHYAPNMRTFQLQEGDIYILLGKINYINSKWLVFLTRYGLGIRGNEIASNGIK